MLVDQRSSCVFPFLDARLTQESRVNLQGNRKQQNRRVSCDEGFYSMIITAVLIVIAIIIIVMIRTVITTCSLARVTPRVTIHVVAGSPPLLPLPPSAVVAPRGRARFTVAFVSRRHFSPSNDKRIFRTFELTQSGTLISLLIARVYSISFSVHTCVCVCTCV